MKFQPNISETTSNDPIILSICHSNGSMAI